MSQKNITLRSARTSMVFGAILFVGILAVYFRTYTLHGGLFQSSASLARTMVDQAMMKQVRDVLSRQMPQLSAEELNRAAGLQLERLKRQDVAGYEATVRQAAGGVTKARQERLKIRYLLEADPYHYLHQTEEILSRGVAGSAKRSGKVLQPLMRAPRGHWESFSLHPYVGAFLYRAYRVFVPDISVVETVAWQPILFTLLILFVYAWFAGVLGMGVGATVFGMLTLALSPIYIQRSFLGWYDTDPYNFLFPVAVLGLLFRSFQKPEHATRDVVVAAFLTGLYSVFWTGWPFLFVLIPGSLFLSLITVWAVGRQKASAMLREGLLRLGFFLVVSIASLAFFLTPEGLGYSVSMSWYALNQFALSSSAADLWPNIFLTVGEAASITFKKLIFLSGNYVTIFLAALGLLWEGKVAMKGTEPAPKRNFLFLVFFSAPLLFMSLKTERFSVLFVIPLSIFVMFAVNRLLDFVPSFRENGKVSSWFARAACSRSAVLWYLMVLYLPLALVTAHVVSRGEKPIMDDVWHKALTEIRARTPEDAIINSWWPPGYFITGVAKRRVTLDGGTQHFHEAYWMARALMAEDERESAGFLRMMNVSGDEALEFLQAQGMAVPEAVELISRVVGVSRREAEGLLPGNMDAQQRNAFLDKTHGQGVPPPAYVFIYNDLVDQNLAVSTIAQWDFKKARTLRAMKKEGAWRKGPGGGENATSQYVQEMMAITGPFLKYQTAVPLERRDGEIFLFPNGVVVNWALKEALISSASLKVRGRPRSLFYMEQGRLVEREFTGAGALDVSVLVFNDAGTYYSVIADPRLIRSMLFRFYYLKGEGLTLFKDFLNEGVFPGGTVIRVFQVAKDYGSPEDS